MGSLLAKFRWKKTEWKPAAEQETQGEEGTRRDIPEREYEREPESKTELPPTYDEDTVKKSEPQSPTLQSSPIEKQDDAKVSEPQSPVLQSSVVGKQDDEISKETVADATDSSIQEKSQEISVAGATDSSIEEKSPEICKETGTGATDSSIQEKSPEISVETMGATTDSSIQEKSPDENDNANVEVAVVKIQAGIRGYLTRKTLKEQRDSDVARKSPIPEEQKQG